MLIVSDWGLETLIATVTPIADAECERAMTKRFKAQLKLGDIAASETAALKKD